MLALGGQDVRALALLVRAAHADLVGTEIPSRLQTGRFETVAMSDQHRTVISYSKSDALELPRQLLDVLHHFDGRPRAEVAERLALSEGVELDDELVRKLVDFGVLIAAVGRVRRAL